MTATATMQRRHGWTTLRTGSCLKTISLPHETNLRIPRFSHEDKFGRPLALFARSLRGDTQFKGSFAVTKVACVTNHKRQECVMYVEQELGPPFFDSGNNELPTRMLATTIA